MTRFRVPRIRKQISQLPRDCISPTERVVLRALAEYGDWETGQECRPMVDTLVADTGLHRRTIQRALASLSCSNSRSHQTRSRCRHRGLIVKVRRAMKWRPATYDVVDLEPIAVEPEGVQGHLTELLFVPRRATIERMERSA